MGGKEDEGWLPEKPLERKNKRPRERDSINEARDIKDGIPILRDTSAFAGMNNKDIIIIVHFFLLHRLIQSFCTKNISQVHRPEEKNYLIRDRVPSLAGCMHVEDRISFPVLRQRVDYKSVLHNFQLNSGTMGHEPEFLEPLQNVTVTAGRDIKLQCSVRHLGSYKVRPISK